MESQTINLSRFLFTLDDRENHSKSRKRVYDKFLGVFVAQKFAKIFTSFFFVCVGEFGNEVNNSQIDQ